MKKLSDIARRRTRTGVIFAFLVPGIHAQMIGLVNSTYVETFVGNPRVSGNLLVGLEWAPLKDAKFDAKRVGIFLLPPLQGRKACVEVSSQDGRYFAQNLYQLSNRQGQESFESKTQYLTPLQRYNASEMAVSVRLVDDCNSAARGELVPARLAESQSNDRTANSPEQKLVAYLNADKQLLTVWLLRGSERKQATCETAPNAVRISFSSSCVFDSPQTGDYVLLVQVQERFTSRETRFDVSIR